MGFKRPWVRLSPLGPKAIDRKVNGFFAVKHQRKAFPSRGSQKSQRPLRERSNAALRTLWGTQHKHPERCLSISPISISYTFHSTNWKKICPVTLEKELEKQRTNSKKTDLTVLPRTEKTANLGLKNTKQTSWFCPKNAKKQLCEKDFIRKRRKVTDERTLKIEHKCDKMRRKKI